MILPNNYLSREFSLEDGLYYPPGAQLTADQPIIVSIWSGWKTTAIVNLGVAVIRPRGYF